MRLHCSKKRCYYKYWFKINWMKDVKLIQVWFLKRYFMYIDYAKF